MKNIFKKFIISSICFSVVSCGFRDNLRTSSVCSESLSSIKFGAKRNPTLSLGLGVAGAKESAGAAFMIKSTIFDGICFYIGASFGCNYESKNHSQGVACGMSFKIRRK